LTAYGKDGYGALLPHLQHSYNSSQIDIVLDRFNTSEGYAGKSRFALQLVLVDSIPGEGLDQVNEKRSLDDEHTPGVFMV
jgi:Lysosomal transcription factor, NCU-G1